MMASITERLGPVARALISPGRWKDQYPAYPEYRRELDTLLSFADSQGCLANFVPRLQSKAAQRDEALEELRVAYLLHHSGFPIVQWSPQGLDGKVGEYLVAAPEGQNIFVEVKSPGWEGELSDAQREAGRTKEPKYRGLEGGAIGNWRPVQKRIVAAYSKFAPVQANLLVIADDLMVSLLDLFAHVEIAVYADDAMYGEMGYFTSSTFENLGGLAVFRALLQGDGIHYEFKLFDNPYALPSTRLPKSLLRFKRTEEDVRF
jgi:hypothetical protein